MYISLHIYTFWTLSAWQTTSGFFGVHCKPKHVGGLDGLDQWVSHQLGSADSWRGAWGSVRWSKKLCMWTTVNTPKVCGNLRSCNKFIGVSRIGFAETMGSLQDAIRFYESHIHFWVDPSFQHFKHHHLKKPPLPESLASSACALSIDFISLSLLHRWQYPRGREWRGLWWALSLKRTPIDL